MITADIEPLIGGTHQLLAMDVVRGHTAARGFFPATVTFSDHTGATVMVTSKDRNAGEPRRYSRTADHLWSDQHGSMIALYLRL